MPSRVIHDLRLPPDHSDEDLAALAARAAGRPEQSVRPGDFRILRQSVDARRKPDIVMTYTVELDPTPLALSGIQPILSAMSGHCQLSPARARPVVVGCGPAGLFAALCLAMAGRCPILLEQGRPVEERMSDVGRYWETGCLDPLSNVQFGEGGAGTFSDGKLTTGIKDARCRQILEELVLAGAPDSILTLAKPHVGTDNLRTAVNNLCRKIMLHGGEIRFYSRMTDILTDASGRKINGLTVERRKPGERPSTAELPAEQVILAIGHSARETFRHLSRLPLALEAKPFSIGVRIEHPQVLINHSQYGRSALSLEKTRLPPADYKLACHLPSGRSVYTFCMCPGGQVVAAASQPGTVVTNGMSRYRRDGANANSALLVGVIPADFPEPGPLGGMLWQETLEQNAFSAGGENGRAPAQRLGSFLGRAGLRQSCEQILQGWPAPEASYRPGVTWRELDGCLPSFILAAIREALPAFDRKINGFAYAEAILTGVETRSSSPLRILRGSNLQAGLEGLYPCGEGAGYAGGIMSAAADGLRCAESVLQK